MKHLILIGLLFNAAAIASENTACDSLRIDSEKVRCLEKSGRFDEALFILHRLMAADSSDKEKGDRYLSLLIKCDDKPGLRQYLPFYEKQIMRHPAQRILCSQGYDQVNNTEQALIILEKAYEREKRFEYLERLLDIVMARKQYDYAGGLVQTILQRDSLYARAYYCMGMVQLNPGMVQKVREKKSEPERLREALIPFRRAAVLDTSDERSWLEIATIFKKLNQKDSACAAYERALRIKPDNFRLLLEYADLLGTYKKDKEALVFYERAFRLDSMNLDLLQRIETAHRRLGSYNSYYLIGQERLADALPDTLSIRYNLAVEYTHRHRDELAKTCFKKVLRKRPDFRDALRGLSAIYLKEESLSLAEPLLKQILELPGYREIDAYNYALCLVTQKDTIHAVEAFAHVLTLNPRHAPSAFFMGTWYYNDKEYDKTVAVLISGLSYPDSAAVHRMRGGALFHLATEDSTAIRELSACVNTREEDETLHYMLGTLYERVGERKRAVLEYRRCLDMAASEDPNIDYYKSRIRALK
ncbi:MAG: hypothetical protein A2293_02575 [Elusimicrobia bacterium RIFOXYB2_FULL_49_7]|nr:MAG: hypothetical protein A2293_02575 [Elusimicrobia bacterium RIFOXYB2_FULL_49_7]